MCSILTHPAPILSIYAESPFLTAIYYLSQLFSLGNRVRDRRLVGLRSEHLVRRAIDDYISWAMHDAGLFTSSTPVHAITNQKGPHRSVDYVVDKIKYKLQRLSAVFRRANSAPATATDLSTNSSSGPVRLSSDDVMLVPSADRSKSYYPVLTGFVVTGTILAVVTMETDPEVFPRIEESALRFIASFDFSEDGMDVWNAFAVAITVMRARKTMREMRKTMGGEVDGEEDDDDSEGEIERAGDKEDVDI